MTMTKTDLQKELLEKVKPGTKPSDLKKKKLIKPKEQDDRRLSGFDKPDEGYISDDNKIPPAPPLPNKQIQQLEKDIKYWSNTANNHLKNLQLAQVRITLLEEENQRLKSKKPESELLAEKNKQIEIIAQENEKNLEKANKATELLNKQSESIKNATQLIKQQQEKILDLTKTIETMKNQAETKPETKQPTEPNKTFHCSECNQTKPQDQLTRVFGQYSFCLECSQQARLTATQQKQEPQPQEFICHLCQRGKKAVPTKMKLDSTLTEYLICQDCKPLAKKFNEADLITDDL